MKKTKVKITFNNQFRSNKVYLQYLSQIDKIEVSKPAANILIINGKVLNTSNF